MLPWMCQTAMNIAAKDAQRWWRAPSSRSASASGGLGLPPAAGAGRSLPVWPGIVATLISLGLLLALHHVVRGSVKQGELRRAAAAELAQASWRCNAMQGQGARDRCRLQLNAAQSDGLSVRR
jgi:hypothetical protein